MSDWLLFSILSPILWGCTVIIDSVFRRHVIKNNFALSWLVSFLRFPVAIIILLIVGFDNLLGLHSLWMIMAGMFWVLPVFLYFKALEFEENTRISLMFTLTPIFALFLANIFIDETLSNSQSLAFLLILSGGMFAALKPKNPNQKKWQLSRAFGIIALACFLWASGDVMFKAFEVYFPSYPSALALFMLGISLPSLFTLFVRKGRNIISEQIKHLTFWWWILILIDISLGILATFSLTYALKLGKVSLTNVIFGLEPLIVFIIGLLFSQFFSKVLREDLSPKSLLLKGLSFILMIAGLIFLQY